MLTVVPQERDDEVVAQGEQVHRIAEKVRDPVVTRYERHEQELKDVEEDPDWKKGSDGDLREPCQQPTQLATRQRGLLRRSSSQTPVPLPDHLQADRKVPGVAYLTLCLPRRT